MRPGGPGGMGPASGGRPGGALPTRPGDTGRPPTQRSLQAAPAAAPAAVAKRAAPVLDTDTLRNKTRATLDEYFLAGEKGLKEAVDIFQSEMSGNSQSAVEAVFYTMADKKVNELGGAVSALLKALTTGQFVSSGELEQALAGEFAGLYDRDMDCPGFSAFFALVIGTLAADGLIGVSIITQAFAHEDTVEFGDMLAGRLFVAAITVIRDAKSIDVVKQGLPADWDVFCLANPRDRDGVDAGKAKLLQTLQDGLGDGCATLFPAVVAASANEKTSAVGSFLIAGLEQDSLDAIDVPALVKWLQDDANVSADTRKKPEFIQAIALPILKRGCKKTLAEGEKASPAAQADEKAAFVKLCKLLEPFVEEQTNLQAEVLFVAQAICEENGHPNGMMQRIMVALYNGDVCEADACVAWKDNTDDAREAGKMKCIFSTSKFFRTIEEQMREAEQEEEEEEEDESD